MNAYFLDSSALVKRYIKETGTIWTIGLFKHAKANRIYLARICFVEVVSAITRRARSNSLSQISAGKSIARFKRAFKKRFRHIEISEALIERAADLAEKYALRGYDAVQLSAVLTANNARITVGASPLIFVCADDNLNDAAKAEGLAVENPNTYP